MQRNLAAPLPRMLTVAEWTPLPPCSERWTPLERLTGRLQRRAYLDRMLSNLREVNGQMPVSVGSAGAHVLGAGHCGPGSRTPRDAQHGARRRTYSGWLVQAAITAVVALLPPADVVEARRVGIDEHQYRSVRWFRDQHWAWRRFQP